MKGRNSFLFIFMTLSSFAFGQNTLEQKDSIARTLTPIDGKAIVYILRPTTFGALIRMNLECDSVHIGSTKSWKYVYTVLPPGKHTFLSKSENDLAMEITLEGGKIYYIQQQVKMGMAYAETGLKLLDEDQGKKYLKKCKLSKDNIYTPPLDTVPPQNTTQPSQDTAQLPHPPLVITPLTGDLYIYTTWGTTGGQAFPANGMYLVTAAGVVVMDSPWDTTQFQPLLDSIWRRHHQPVVLCIATHFHEDRTAALDFFRTKGVKTYTSSLTDVYSREHGDHRAEFLFDKDTVFTVGGYSIQTFYPGEGHTRDNIVVWFGTDRVLYGGCLVKSTESPTLGNMADGNPGAYAATIRRVMEKFPNPAYIIPGHQAWESTQSLQHTLEMADQAGTHPANH